MEKKKSVTARTTISMPMALKNRMKKVGVPVNWSEIAVVAFEQKLAEITQKREMRTMDDVIERLRGSKRKSDAAECKKGEAAGREWAIRDAEAAQMEHLAYYFDRLQEFEKNTVFESEGNGSGAEVVFSVMEPDCEWDRDTSLLFWKQVLGEDGSDAIFDTEFLRGFVQGVLGLWNDVRGRL